PQEEQRYLYALAGFQRAELVAQTLERAVGGEIRTQDAPFVVRTLLMSVYARELAWDFVKRHWDQMDRLYPKHGLRRMCEGAIGLATPELERDVHAFFAARKIDFGGKTLEQYLEQLRVAVALRADVGLGLRDTGSRRDVGVERDGDRDEDADDRHDDHQLDQGEASRVPSHRSHGIPRGVSTLQRRCQPLGGRGVPREIAELSGRPSSRGPRNGHN